MVGEGGRFSGTMCRPLSLPLPHLLASSRGEEEMRALGCQPYRASLSYAALSALKCRLRMGAYWRCFTLFASTTSSEQARRSQRTSQLHRGWLWLICRCCIGRSPVASLAPTSSLLTQQAWNPGERTKCECPPAGWVLGCPWDTTNTISGCALALFYTVPTLLIRYGDMQASFHWKQAFRRCRGACWDYPSHETTARLPSYHS